MTVALKREWKPAASFELIAAVGLALLLLGADSSRALLRPQERAQEHEHHDQDTARENVPALQETTDRSDTSAGHEQQTPTLHLAELERRALESHPALAGSNARAEAARGRLDQAGRWRNPELGLLAEEVALRDDVDGGKVGALVAQSFVLGGKRAADRALASARLQASQADADAARYAILAGIRRAFYRALAAQKAISRNRQLAALADEASLVTDQLFNTGAADRPDRLAAQVEARRALLELDAAHRELDVAWAQLEAAAGVESLNVAPLEDVFVGELQALDHQVLLPRLLERSPELRGAQLAVESAEAALERERRASVPDLDAEVALLENRERAGQNGPRLGTELAAELRIALPLRNRNRGAIAAANAERSAAAADATLLRVELAARFAGVLARYRRAREEVAAYRDDIVPAASEAHALYLARYRQMAAAYPQVLVAQRTLFQVEAEALAATLDAWTAKAELELLLASDF